MFINPNLRKLLDIYLNKVLENTARIDRSYDKQDYTINNVELKWMEPFFNGTWIFGLLIVTIPFIIIINFHFIRVKYKRNDIQLSFIEKIYVYIQFKKFLMKLKKTAKKDTYEEFRNDHKKYYDQDFINKANTLINK